MRSKNAVRNIASSLMLQIVILISGLIVPSLIIKSFGSNVNGLVSSITQFLAYISLLEAGIGPVIKASLYKPISNNDKQSINNILKASEKFFRMIAIIFLVYLVGLSFIYPLIVKEEFSWFYTMSLVLIISISTFAEYYFGMTYKLYLQAEQKKYISSIIQIITYILNVIAIVILIRLNANIQVVKLISGFIFVLRPIIQNIYIKRKYCINLKDTDGNYQLKHKWDGLAQHIAAVIHNNTDITILTMFTSLSEVSVYSIYAMIVRGVKSIVQSFTGGIDASFGDMIAKGEEDKLNKVFNTYEILYYTIITIVYICTIALIIPFVDVYTKNISDVNYIRPLFGYLIVLSEFAWSIRLPYSSLTLAAGHFKQTKNGAWLEAILNIVVSIVLVIKYGIIGVAIGTLVSMIVRTIEFAYHANKYILKRKLIISTKKIFVVVIETVLVLLISNFIPLSNISSYSSWVFYAIIIFFISSIITFGINFILYKDEFMYGYQVFRRTKKCKSEVK